MVPLIILFLYSAQLCNSTHPSKNPHLCRIQFFQLQATLYCNLFPAHVSPRSLHQSCSCYRLIYFPLHPQGDYPVTHIPKYTFPLFSPYCRPVGHTTNYPRIQCRLGRFPSSLTLGYYLSCQLSYQVHGISPIMSSFYVYLTIFNQI